MSQTDLIPLAAVALATMAASVTDLWKFKVYNVLTVPTLLLGLATSTVLGGWAGLVSSLLGAGLGFVLLVFFFAAGGVGAGDVKLLASVGAWLGPHLTFEVFVASAFFGGAYSLALVLNRGGVLQLALKLIAAKASLLAPGSWRLPESTIEVEVCRPDRRRRLVPFAAMTCLGFFATIAWWGSDLDRAWPPYDGHGVASTVAGDSGGVR
jgi:prepilin peptidase CpaA